MKRLIISKSRLLAGIIVLAAILGIDGCTKNSSYTSGSNNGGGTKGGPGTNEVWIQGFAYTPSVISVTAGTTITWTNKDPVNHTVTSDTGLFDGALSPNGGTFSHTFTTAGTYSYHCSIHTNMTGTVKVN